MMATESNLQGAGTIWVVNLDEPVPAVSPRLTATFHRVGPDLVPAFVSTMDHNASADLLQRFETGRRCYAAWVEDQLASYGWVSFEEEHIGELNLRIQLLPGEVYIWDCATIPAFRQNGLYSALLGYIIKELRAEGLCRAWIGADMDNRHSQQGMARAGFHHVADLVVEPISTGRQVGVQAQPDMPEHIVVEARRVFLNDPNEMRNSTISLIA